MLNSWNEILRGSSIDVLTGKRVRSLTLIAAAGLVVFIPQMGQAAESAQTVRVAAAGTVNVQRAPRPAPKPTNPPSSPAPEPTPTAAPTTCTGVQISPGMSADSIQRLVDSNPKGTVFCFSRGTYVLNHYITLKDANQFICPERRSCVLTGLDQYRGALTAAFGTSKHVIRGFVVEHFIAAPGQWPNAGLQLRDGGLIEDNESRYNKIGININSNQTIRNNFIHHNLQYGLNGGPATNLLIEGNELAWNNSAHLDPNNDAGGSKIIGGSPGTNILTWRRNHVHDNWGNGIWSDGNVRNTTYEENVVENNGGAGILHEISWNAVIRNNTLRNNNTFELGKGKSCWWGAQIALNNSQGVAIYSNTVEAVGTNAICLANTSRSEPVGFPQSLASISVTNNVIKMRGEVNVGMVGDSVGPNVTFSGNTYYVDSTATDNWSYMSSMRFPAWQAAGHDVDGRILTW